MLLVSFAGGAQAGESVPAQSTCGDIRNRRDSMCKQGSEMTDGVQVRPMSNRKFGRENICAKAKVDFANKECIGEDERVDVGPQSGSIVDAGYKGEINTTSKPIMTSYLEAGLCPVNVHWHLGAEHLSTGQYDANGTGPEEDQIGKADNHSERRLASVRLGNRCHHYNNESAAFTTEYDWKHCIGMHVGETYEVHWPHSKAGACGTPDQFQTPFYDGVFCLHAQGFALTPSEEVLPTQVGVQGQIFTIINDEDYYYPELMWGMIVDGEYGKDMAKYTGSTTGTSRDNKICSQYTPITWQVDRKCHLISASSFDKMCADMMSQKDDMSADLAPTGARELVADFIASNQDQR